MSDIIREIDDELQAKRYASLARKYAKYVIVFVVLLSSVVGGYSWYDNRSERLQGERARGYHDLLEAGVGAESFLSFASLRDDGFARMAERRAVSLYLESGEVEPAIELLRSIGSGGSGEYGDYARIMLFLLDGEAVGGSGGSGFEILEGYADAVRAIESGDMQGALSILRAIGEGSGNRGANMPRALFNELINAIESRP